AGISKRELAVCGVHQLAEPGHYVAEVGEGGGFPVCPSFRPALMLPARQQMRPEIRQAAVVHVDPAVISNCVVVGQIDTVQEVDHRPDYSVLGDRGDALRNPLLVFAAAMTSASRVRSTTLSFIHAL